MVPVLELYASLYRVNSEPSESPLRAVHTPATVTTSVAQVLLIPWTIDSVAVILQGFNLSDWYDA